MNGNKTPWVIIGLAGLCLLCLVPALVLGSTAGGAGAQRQRGAWPATAPRAAGRAAGAGVQP